MKRITHLTSPETSSPKESLGRDRLSREESPLEGRQRGVKREINNTIKNFKLCVSLSESNFQHCYAYAKQAELAELRLDMVSFSVAQLKELFGLKTRFIVTCRSGKIKNSEKEKKLKQAISLGAFSVDIEIDSDVNFQKEILLYANKNNCKTIFSYHNFTETPTKTNLQEIINRSKEYHPWKIKIATMANSEQDVATVMSLYQDNPDLIAFCMGEKGKMSRLSSLLLGAEFTFVSPAKGKETALGQIDKETMLKLIHSVISEK